MKRIVLSLIAILSFCIVVFSCATKTVEDKVKAEDFHLEEFLPSVQERMESAFKEGDSKRTWNLRNDADFEVEVADGVWWVPANILGKTRYTNNQIASIVTEDPRIKRELIGNLYEAIQLFQISGFSDGDDNIRSTANGINWEHHKPGYYAITSNNGCCATDSNWLLYLLDGKYDEVGMMSYSNSDGGGHVFNYIKDGDYYYFIDLTHYRNDFQSSAEETGDMNVYWNTDFIAGNIHRTKDPMQYVQYCLDNYSNPPVLFTMYPGHEVVSIDSVRTANGITITYNKEIEDYMTVVYDKPDDNLTYGFAVDKSRVPDWSLSPTVPYTIVSEYDVVYLMSNDYKIMPGSGFGSGFGDTIKLSVLLNDEVISDYEYELSNQIGTATKNDDGSLWLHATKAGRSNLIITVNGVSYPPFRWHQAPDFRFNLDADTKMNPEKDTWNIRDNADFCAEIVEGVYWVPANSLGKTRYTNKEIAELVNKTPEEKRARIGNLYEAIQLFQISGFSDGDDNIRSTANGINWEHHKPGYYAITSNNGCCATDSNWLLYLLDGKYDEVGMMSYSNSDGGGHVFNYIKDGDYYYFIDLTHYRNDFRASSIETGNGHDYIQSDFIAGNIHKTRDPLLYVQYCLDLFNDPPVLFTMYPGHEVVSIDSVRTANGITITYNKEIEDYMTVVYDNPDDNLTYGFAVDNSDVPDWSLSPTVPYTIVSEYDVVYLKSDEYKIMPDSGFGAGVGSEIKLLVILNGYPTSNYSVELKDSIGELKMYSDGSFGLKSTKNGDCAVEVTVNGQVYSFRWHQD